VREAHPDELVGNPGVARAAATAHRREHQRKANPNGTRSDGNRIGGACLRETAPVRPVGGEEGPVSAMTPRNLIYRHDNDELGIQARVWLIEGRHHVTVLDLDADEMVPCAKIFPDRDQAIAYARRCVS
jgi:hypothetical protein